MQHGAAPACRPAPPSSSRSPLPKAQLTDPHGIRGQTGCHDARGWFGAAWVAQLRRVPCRSWRRIRPIKQSLSHSRHHSRPLSGAVLLKVLVSKTIDENIRDRWTCGAGRRRLARDGLDSRHPDWRGRRAGAALSAERRSAPPAPARRDAGRKDRSHRQTASTPSRPQQPTIRRGANILPKFAIGQAVAKTITFRMIVTTLDFTTNYVVIGEIATAAGLSTFNLIAGPLFYLAHEAAWNYFGLAGRWRDLAALTAGARTADGERATSAQVHHQPGARQDHHVSRHCLDHGLRDQLLCRAPPRLGTDPIRFRLHPWAVRLFRPRESVGLFQHAQERRGPPGAALTARTSLISPKYFHCRARHASGGRTVNRRTRHCYADIAILLCTYNGARFLPAQLASLAAQSFTNWRLFVSDDGSSDDTLAIVSEHKDRLGAAPVDVRNGPRQGFVKNFLSLACDPSLSFDYYAYCDQDDIWEPDKLARASSACRASRRISLRCIARAPC